MSESLIVALVIALFTAIPPTIMALAAYRSSRRAEVQVEKVGAVTDGLVVKAEGLVVKTEENTVLTQQTATQTEDLLVKTDEIHKLTNSNLSAVMADLAAANAEIKTMHTLVQSLLDDNQRRRRTDLTDRDRPPEDPADGG